ncbi:hypothetical protein, partial [Psychrobacter phenylpyruvicus]
MGGAKTPEKVEYEKRLRRRLKILKEQFEQGKIHIAEGMNVEKSLLAVRQGPDGEIDLDTVDEYVRSMALAVTAMHDREELKKEISLSEIQNIYFNFIEDNFGHYYQLMIDNNLTPHDVGKVLTQNQKSVEEITENLGEFLNVIDSLWKELGEIAQIHVEDMHGNIKGVFGGDLFPSHDENIASTCGIYTDTIVLPDPFLRSKHVFENFSNKSRVYYLVKHAMNILQYKELACANLEVPIVVILPDQSKMQEEEREFFQLLGKDDSVIHSNKLFGRKFESFDELIEFAEGLDTIERAVEQVKDKSRVLFDTDWKGDLSSQIKKALELESYAQFVGNPGLLLASQALGRMSVSNELLIKSRRLNGTPIIDAPTSWQYLTWKMEYDSERAESKTGNHDLHIVRGLQDLATNEMEWLGNIPPEALIDIRKQGAMDDIRSMLGNSIEDIVRSNPDNFYRSRDQIFDNINDAFHQHRKNIEELKSKKWKFAGKDIGSWMVMGTLEVAAAVTGTPAWGLAA